MKAFRAGEGEENLPLAFGLRRRFERGFEEEWKLQEFPQPFSHLKRLVAFAVTE